LGSEAFNNCKSLENVTFGGRKSPSYSGSVFGGCNKLACVNVPPFYDDNEFCEKPICAQSSDSQSFSPSTIVVAILLMSSILSLLQ